MDLPEVYIVDTEIHTDVQLETPMIKSGIQSKLIPISHASWGEILKSELVGKEIPT